MNNKNWFTAKVIHGKKLARTLGFPTINLDNVSHLAGKKEGVYAARVKIEDKIYNGVLYYGPRLILQENQKIVEVYLFDSVANLYGSQISFQLTGFIRPPENFPDLSAFKKQLALDCQIARKILK